MHARTQRSSIIIVMALLSLTAPTTHGCDETCLRQAMNQLKSDLRAGIPPTLDPSVETRENMLITTPAHSAWKEVASVESSMEFADTTTGNVVSRNGVRMRDGTPAYLSIRLKMSAGEISEIEFSSDTERANAAYVWNLPKIFTTTVPARERMSRESMRAIVTRYFQSLTDHKGVRADFDDERCNRYHSGNQVTNVQSDSVESQGARTCFKSIDGPKPWGPAIEQRFPIVDPEHGIVVGQCLLLYADQVMYVSEIFKIEAGRIVSIDNIGLVKPGRNHTTGFGSAQ